MYQGKFSNNQKGRSTQELLKERAAQQQAQRQAPAKRPVPQSPVPQSPAPAAEETQVFKTPQQIRQAPQNPQVPRNPASQPAAPQSQAAQVPYPGARPSPVHPQAPQTTQVPYPGARPSPVHPQPSQAAQAPYPGAKPSVRPAGPASQPASRSPQKPVAPKAPQPAPGKSSKVFYSCYFGFILLFCLVTFLGLTWLRGWLTDYEAAQPVKMAEAVFQQLFVNPNWGLLYDNSITKGTDLEGRDSYIAHMQDKVGGNQLTYQETSAGLSGDKKYIIKLGDEKIASFILKGDAEHITDIPNWQLGDIELIFRYDNSYKIQIQEGHKAIVNGMELDESYTIMKASTVAQDFLPVGTTGIRMWTQQISNLMGKPSVKVLNEKGEEMPLLYDQETKTFTEQTPANSITEDQRAAAIGAAEVYGKYMISQANRGELAKYFDASSDI